MSNWSLRRSHHTDEDDEDEDKREMSEDHILSERLAKLKRKRSSGHDHEVDFFRKRNLASLFNGVDAFYVVFWQVALVVCRSVESFNCDMTQKTSQPCSLATKITSKEDLIIMTTTNLTDLAILTPCSKNALPCREVGNP